MCVGGYLVDRVLRLIHKIRPNPAYQDVRAIRCREMLAPGGTNSNAHLANAHQVSIQTI
jgi:hypothetical protein